MSVSPSRRRVLQVMLAAPAAAACTSSSPRRAAPPVDPDVALRVAAVERERALIAQYDAAPPSPVVAAIRAEHEQHLASLLGPSPAPSSSPAATARTDLAVAERAAAAAHAADALQASPSLAAVLASLAASEASHPVALS